MKHGLWILILLTSAPFAGATEYKSLRAAGSEVLIPLQRVSPEEILGNSKKTRAARIIQEHKEDAGHSIRSLMSPVKNQGPRGTCNAFAAIALIEAFDRQDYSEQCLAYFSSNEDAGFVQQRLNWIRENGVRREADCPYGRDRNRVPSLAGIPTTAIPYAFESIRFWDTDAIEYIQNRLAVSSPIAVDIYVVGEDQWNYGPFIYTPSDDQVRDECGRGLCGNHSIVITGFNDLIGMVEFKNSWGSGWGQGGYGYLSYDYLLRFGNNQLISY